MKNMKQRSKKISNLFMCCICAFAIVAIAVGTGYTLAFFSHSTKTGPQSLSFGTIVIQEGSNAANVNLGAIVPGQVVNVENVENVENLQDKDNLISFKTTENSLSCYLRVKIAIVCEKSKDTQTDAEKKFIESLTIGTDENKNIILGLSENTSAKWSLNSDGYYYFVTSSNTSNNLQPVTADSGTIGFLKSVTFPKNIKNEIVVNGTPYKDVQNGLSFKFEITCQAIQSAHVSGTLNDDVKNIFNSIQ